MTYCQKVHKWGVRFLTVNKIHFKHFVLCCFVCAFIIGQYHSGNNMSSKSGAAGDTKKKTKKVKSTMKFDP